MKSYLCVGGPHAGQKYDIKGNHFNVPIKKAGSTLSTSPNDLVVETVETMTYVEETFHTHQGDITFWIPLGQTWFETMTLLLEAYELTNAAITEMNRLKGKMK